MKPEDPTNNPVGRTFGSYLVESQVGAGGMGEVYRARDTRLDRLVAIKLLPMAVASDPERFRRFHVEARAASSLNHPHILVVHDIGESEGRPFIVTELVAGETLRQRMDGRSIAVREAIDIGTQVASALAAAHGRGIVHRDIKPENIMVRPDGYLKVLDFGLAKLSLLEDDGERATLSTDPGLIMGTPEYMSPEQAAGEEVDFRSDQFAFGVVMYELLSGRRPFQRRSAILSAAAVITDTPEPLARLRPDLPPPLWWAIERCLSKRKDDRYKTTDELHRDLATIQGRISDVRAPSAVLPPANLPAAATNLVGRDRDAAAVQALLARADVRWVTLTGPGGVGKTRLATHVARTMTDAFAGATYFVPLAGVADADHLVSSLALMLDVHPGAGETPWTAVARHLRALAVPVLLILDNFEHIATAAVEVATLVERCEAVKILASSRARLNISAEHEYQVSPLVIPDGSRVRRAATVADVPAVRLFVERARAARAGFALTDENAGAIADICLALDGLPLAIELAAARVKMIPPEALLARVAGKSLSLDGGARDRPARQQTLRATIDWGYELLTPGRAAAVPSACGLRPGMDARRGRGGVRRAPGPGDRRLRRRVVAHRQEPGPGDGRRVRRTPVHDAVDHPRVRVRTAAVGGRSGVHAQGPRRLLPGAGGRLRFRRGRPRGVAGDVRRRVCEPARGHGLHGRGAPGRVGDAIRQRAPAVLAGAGTVAGRPGRADAGPGAVVG